MSRRTTREPLTDAERDARRKADRDRLDQAARALLTSEGWQRWIRVRATNGLSRYSVGNQLLIASDCYHRGITPTYVAGFRAFLDLNRCVRKGQKAIKILAPCVKPRHDDENGEKRVFFRTVPVFDVSMTDPLPGKDPIPLEPPSQPLAGDSHVHLVEPLIALAAELGFTVEIRELPEDGPGGWCDPQANHIVVGVGAGNAQVRTLIHEIAHALGIGYADYGRERAEVLVDCVTFVVCSSVGLDVGGESIPYVAGWGEDGGLVAIRDYAATVDTVARRIEDELQPAATTEDGVHSALGEARAGRASS